MKKIISRILRVFLILLFLLMIIFSIPFVQTRLGKITTNYLNKEFGTNIIVKKLDLSLLGNVQLKGIEIKDHHQDTLIFVNKLRTSLLNIKRIVDNKLNLGNATLSGAYFYMKTYKGEKDDNLSVFLSHFDDDKPKDTISTPFVLKSESISFNNLTYKLVDENKKKSLEFSATNSAGKLEDFSLVGPNVSMKIKNLKLIDNRGINVTNLSTKFLYTKKKMELLNITLKTDNETQINGDLIFKYKREDFVNFTDKVKLKANFKKSLISVRDLNKLYNELGGADKIYFSGRVKGVLNNFSAENISMYSKNGLQFRGNAGFVNAFNSSRGFVFDSKIKKLSSNYYQLRNILPNVLGKTIPTEFKKLGKFNLSGLIKVTPEQIDATLNVKSKIGAMISDLQLTNIADVDNAAYSGEVEFNDFDLGSLVENPLLGKISLKADVNGAGFNVDNINTIIIGKVSKLEFKGYTYENLNVNGQFQNKKFDGLLQAEDQNFNLTFEGLADFSSKVHKFDFTTNIAKIDLLKTNLFVRDSISVLKGKIKLDVTGNKINDMIGKANFKDIVYTNQKQQYEFKEFSIESSIKDSIQTIRIDSKDIVEGQLTGRFKFAELLSVTRNALGSVYTNYSPLPVTPNQFINFDFTIYNQIVDVFLPEVSIGTNTEIKGKINANKNTVKLTFVSPKIEAYKNEINKLELRLDNKNKLYNTHIIADKLSNKYYQISKLNLLNRTVNDTLFFKTIFKGGKKETENFNLDFFYTINQEKKSVVGIQKSSFNFKGYDWAINPKNDKNNKVTFDLKDSSYTFSPFLLVSKDQKIKFRGSFQGTENKNLKANFINVKLTSFLPEIENLALEGLINGNINLLQKNGEIRPLANIKIEDLIVNEFSQGTLKAKIEGSNSFDKYKVDVSIRDYKFDNVKVFGLVDFSDEKPMMDMHVEFKNYELNGFSNLGKGVMENFRGRVSGSFTSKGELLNPNFKGELNLIEAGLTFPYLNIDFDFVENAKIELKNQSLIFNNLVLKDTKYDTKGYLSGSITHQDFAQWYFKLDLDTPNLLVLDTKEVEEIPYYGKGFLKGSAQIRGLTSNLTIDVRGKTEKGTVFVIPLSDVTTVDNYKLIHFKKIKKQQKEQLVSEERISGLNLNLDLEVTKEAIAQVVIDKVSGSQLKGSGTGNLDIRISTRGKFLMDGNLIIDKGVYNFKYGGIITKPFKVQKGGTISWNGDPFEAELDLVAIYHAKANPARLLDNIASTRKIPIDLYTKITGGLFNSKQEFDIKIPNADSTVASELEFKLNDNDTNSKMRQFFSLLVTGSFFNEDDLAVNASSLSANTASDLVSNILSDILNSKDGKFKLGLGYTQGDKSNITGFNTDNQIDVSVSTQLSDRVLVNGKVGVPVGANIQSSVVGEVKMEVLLNEEGNFRWTIFNRPNDIQYSIEEEGYTQGTGLSYQVNFNNLKELGKRFGLRKKKGAVKKNDTIIKKSRKLINFASRKKDSLKNESKNN